MHKYFQKIYFVVGLLLVVVAVGVGGYMFLEGYTLIEAYYMTVITVGTVGFMEVRPLSDAGRLFTSTLILSSFVVFTYAISSLSHLIFDGEAVRLLKLYQLEKKVKKLHNHVIVCGYGRIGRQVCEELEGEDQSFVVIETNPELVRNSYYHTEYLVMEGDATSDEVLKMAGIENAKALIATLPNDANNVFIVLTARELNPRLRIISRASLENSVPKLKRAGSDFVILPERIGGTHMASLVMKPDVAEFVRLITTTTDQHFFFDEYVFNPPTNTFQNIYTVQDIEAQNTFGARIIGLKMPDGQFKINPAPNAPIEPGVKLIILGTTEQILKCTGRNTRPIE